MKSRLSFFGFGTKMLLSFTALILTSAIGAQPGFISHLHAGNQLVIPLKRIDTIVVRRQIQGIAVLPAKQFNPFRLNDLGHGVHPNTIITLPNGKKMEAQRYLNEVNNFERYYSSKGYSVRTMGTDAKLWQRQTNYQLFKQQQEKIDSYHKGIKVHKIPYNSSSLAYMPKSQSAHWQQQLVTRDIALAKVIGTLGTSTCNPVVDFDTTWNRSMGESGWFSVGLYGGQKLHGTLIDRNMSMSYEAQCEVVGEKFTLAKVESSFNGDSTGISQAVLNCQVLGQNVFSVNQQLSETISDDFSKDLYLGYEYPFWIGPIPFSVTVAVYGDAGVSYTMEPRKTSANQTVTPHVSVGVDLHGGPDIWVAECGVGGRLTLLNEAIPTYQYIGTRTSWRPQVHGQTYVSADYITSNYFTALAGELYAYAYIYYPCGISWSGIDWCAAGGTTTLFSWPGFYEAYDIINNSKTSCIQNNHTLNPAYIIPTSSW